MQSPIEGTSMMYSFNGARGAGTPRPLLLRDVRNRGIDHRGWSAVTEQRRGRPRIHWAPRRRRVGPTTATATSARPATSRPTIQRLADLERLWLIEATKYNVLPLVAVGDGHPTACRAPTLIPGSSEPLSRAWGGHREQRGRASRTVVLGHRRRRAGRARGGGRADREGGASGRPSTSRAARPSPWQRARHRRVRDGVRSPPAGHHQVRVEFATTGRPAKVEVGRCTGTATHIRARGGSR